MSNIVPLKVKQDYLAELAVRINANLSSVTNMRLATAILLAEAREECLKQGVTFKAWCEENIDYDWKEAGRLARVGASPDPAKALEDLRARQRDNNRASRKRLTDAARGTDTPSPEIITIYPSEEEDTEDGARIRGFLARAEEAASFALDDNMQGIDVTEEMVAAAREAATAWGNLARTLEFVLEEMKNAQEN